MLLLISVIDEKEVESAVAGGADIIDVKNPVEGPLGANFPGVIRKVREITPADIPVSAAIGDAPDKPGSMALAALGAAVCGIQYVKVGLFGLWEKKRAVYLLKEIVRAVKGYDTRIKIIAVAYGDASRIHALPPLECPSAGVEAGVDGCMLDTAIKNHGNLFSNLSFDKIQAFVNECREKGLISALAGSLTEEDIPRIREIGPDITGFRGAACIGDRVKGRIEKTRVERLRSQIC